MTFDLDIWHADYRTQVRFCFSAVSDISFFVFCLVVNQISREWLNGFAPNSQRRRVLSLAGTSFNFKDKGQSSRSPGTKRAVHCHYPSAATKWNTLAANNVMYLQIAQFRRCRGDFSGLRAVYVW